MSTEGKKFLSGGMFIFLVFALIAIVWLGHIGDRWLDTHHGNAFTMSVARISAELRLKTVYPKTDYVIDGIYWNEKSDGPSAQIISPSSPDSSFPLRFNHLGMLKWDGHEDLVAGKRNTAIRLSNQYSTAVRAALAELKTDDLRFVAGLVYRSKDNVEESLDKEHLIFTEDLVLDGVYDIAELGAKAGELKIYFDVDSAEQVNTEQMAQMLLQVRDTLDLDGIPCYAVTCRLQYPGGTNSVYLGLKDFPFTEIYEDGFIERLDAAMIREYDFYLFDYGFEKK